jgi:hypothetical protein
MGTRRAIFFTLVRTDQDSSRAKLLVDSLRAFGGPLADSEMWVFKADSVRLPWGDAVDSMTEVVELSVPERLRGYPFAEKVCACSEAERVSAGSTESLVWASSDTIILGPPVLYELGMWHDAAFRPVHVRNVGLRADAPIDAFWRRVCDAVWLSDIDQLVESFVDGETIRAYFNSHSCSVNPSLGLFRAWRDSFEEVVRDESFQSGPCSDELHRIFLHQAVLSALVVRSVLPGRLRLLPQEYSYPYNLHGSVPEVRRAKRLDDLVTVVYEGQPLIPGRITDIEVSEPLRSWLSARAP